MVFRYTARPLGAYLHRWLHQLANAFRLFSDPHCSETEWTITVGGAYIHRVGCTCGRVFYSTINDPYDNLAVLTRVTRKQAKTNQHMRNYGGRVRD